MNLLTVQYKIHIPQSMETRLVSVATFIEPRKTFEVRHSFNRKTFRIISEHYLLYSALIHNTDLEHFA